MIATETPFMLTTSNDCTVRQWDYESGVCQAVIKFGDPISVGRLSVEYNMLFTACWDKMIRVFDLEQNKIVKSFIASKEAIKCMEIYNEYVFVAGCDPIIRCFNMETGETKLFAGHKGWIYTLAIFDDRLYSGGDDRTIIIWNIANGKVQEQLAGHENGVTTLTFC
mmetsp:Transcript_21356/g.33039  ORF Transcript_21356/g.33039 Transcript_21356/m.33039 type:complete len:166 (-) Transcript_21356:235-732(-)